MQQSGAQPYFRTYADQHGFGIGPRPLDDRIHIVIPVKELVHSKQRLSEVLSPQERSQLSLAMLRDVLSAVFATIARTWVASADAAVLELAREFGVASLPDLDRSHNPAVDFATRTCIERGANAVLVLAADVPLTTPDELAQLVSMPSQRGCALVRSEDGGTNALLRSPGDLFPAQFGGGSFARHEALARAGGHECRALDLPGIAFDIDTPDNLRRLLASPGGTHAQQLLRSWETVGPFASNRFRNREEAFRGS